MRIEMGLLQMEFTGRPDGERPGGRDTYLEYIASQVGDGEDVPQLLTDEQCFEIDREFVQYYHRRICCLALREFDRAVADADHTLALMDFVAAHSPNEDWTASHERYRPFVYFHRTQAAGPGGARDAPAPRRRSKRSTRGWRRSERSSSAPRPRNSSSRTNWSTSSAS